MADGAHHRAAGLFDDGHRRLFHRVAEGVVRGEEVPILVALAYQRGGCAACLGRGGIGVAHHIGLAGFFGQRVSARAGADEDLFLVFGQVADRQRHG